jgi:hypothetical protein
MRGVRAANNHRRTVDGSSGRFITRRLRFVTVRFALATSYLHVS